MDESDKARLAKQAMTATDLLKPGEVGSKVSGAVKDAAANVALRGMAAIGRMAGGDSERSPARHHAVSDMDMNRMFDAIDASETAEFEQQLQAAMAKKAQRQQAHVDHVRRLDLMSLRSSFPPEAREFALLVFNCIDLLEDLSEDAEGIPPTADQLERKEKLLLRVAELLTPKAGPAMVSFVNHVTAMSRRYRQG